MQSLSIVEVGPRDGLQNEAVTLPPEQRIRFIEQLASAGARRIEAVSFVNPARVPQMAGAEEVIAGVRDLPDLALSGLVLNERGLERAADCAIDEVTVVVVASETFSRRNQGAGVTDMVTAARRIVTRAREAGIRSCVMVAAAFGCPFEGEVPVDQVRRVITEVTDAGPDEIAFADTIGVGVPAQVRLLVNLANEVCPGVPQRFHFHNTRNTGYANALTALDLGVRTLDAAVGGYGGCPFAPAATGNIGTEDLAYAAHRSGFGTGLRIDELSAIGAWLEHHLHKPPQTLLPRAGGFPAPTTQRPGQERQV